ncbi:TetR/AcrR family transcriptional regulator [Pseudomonas sp. NPDC090202]|uniref:TetR/AcrR family transcriptional regulator n=1 Tax=unclassified Pseudomonas TaxID=196821 RepID=UPI00383015A4
MRKTKQETAATRRRIIAAARGEFRRHGIAGSGLTALMAAAGMTQGGFYKHFQSKAQLVAESTMAGVDELLEGLGALPPEEGPAGAFNATVNGYLSLAHRDGASGCPYGGLGSELAQGDEQVRASAVAGFERMIALLSRQIPPGEQASSRDQALLSMCAMMGALTVSRMADGEALSAEVLAVVSRQLIGHVGQQATN